MPPALKKMANTSLDTVPVQLRESLRQANIDNLLDHLSKKSQQVLRLGKNEQRGEPDLTSEEKVDILRSKYETNPMIFLLTFGRLLEPSHLNCFSTMRKDSYEINFYLTELERSLSPDGKKRIAKNRRYEALQKLVDTTDYFTEEEMQRRNPILYEQLIGKYHTQEEREAFLFQSATTSSAVGSKSDPSYNSMSRPTPLSDILIAHMSRADGEVSDRRIGQESQINEENVADNEFDDSEDDEGMEAENETSRNHKQRGGDETADNTEEIDDDEKELLKEEFFTTMYRNFLEGKDEEMDYTAIDENPEYDCGETYEQDAEEKYFEKDDDCIDDGESSFLTMKISDGPKSSPEKLTSGEHYDNNGIDESEEDELDAYMKTIEQTLSLKR